MNHFGTRGRLNQLLYAAIEKYRGEMEFVYRGLPNPDTFDQPTCVWIHAPETPAQMMKDGYVPEAVEWKKVYFQKEKIILGTGQNMHIWVREK